MEVNDKLKLLMYSELYVLLIEEFEEFEKLYFRLYCYYFNEEEDFDINVIFKISQGGEEREEIEKEKEEREESDKEEEIIEERGWEIEGEEF